MGCIPGCGCRHHLPDRRWRFGGDQHRVDQCWLVTCCPGILGIVLGAREDIAGRAGVQDEAAGLGEDIGVAGNRESRQDRNEAPFS